MEKLPPELAYIDKKLTEWTNRWPYWCWFVPIWLTPFLGYFITLANYREVAQLFVLYWLLTAIVSMVPMFKGQVGTWKWCFLGGVIPMIILWVLVQVIGPVHLSLDDQPQQKEVEMKSEGGDSAPPS